MYALHNYGEKPMAILWLHFYVIYEPGIGI